MLYDVDDDDDDDDASLLESSMNLSLPRRIVHSNTTDRFLVSVPWD